MWGRKEYDLFYLKHFLYFIFLLNRFDSEIQLFNSKMCLNYDSTNAIIIERKVLLHKIIFYEEKDGHALVWDFLEKLRIRANKSKDCRIQYKQAVLAIQLLQDNGTWLSSEVTKHIDENIWELRPGNNRIFYFTEEEDAFVSLHVFRKKTQKTPLREIERAKRERDDYLARRNQNEDLG